MRINRSVLESVPKYYHELPMPVPDQWRAAAARSGKTTTLYATIHRINTPENKILTAEDPIEYYFPKTNQKQVSE